MASAIIAEDEAVLRDALRELLRTAWPELEVVAECEDGASALEAIATQRPDIAFLDIRMPGLTGLDVARAAADLQPRLQIVFTTAYDQYAIDAFEHGAIDYLLKPVLPARLAATVARLRERMDVGGDANLLSTLVRQLGQLAPVTGAPLTWITASAGRETRLIMIDDVVYFRADNKYTTVMTADGEALLRTPIRELLGMLDARVFKQIHRATIVNIKAIAAVVREDGGKGTLRLKSRPETLAISQPFMAIFRHM